MLHLWSVALVIAWLTTPASAERIFVPPGAGALQAVLDRAADVDVVVLEPGVHRGPVRITRRLSLEGAVGAVLDGGGLGNVVTIEASGAAIRGLTIRGSGRDLVAMNAGVFLTQAATGATVEDNWIEDNLYGVYIHGAEDALVRRNRIVGLREGRVNESGNGISVWNAAGAKVLDNDIRLGRDGIFSIASKRNVFRGNRFQQLRFAVHYMYTNDSEISDNVSTGNVIGFAVMYSHRLQVVGNISDGDRDHGMMFNYANGSRITGNLVLGRALSADRRATSSLHVTEAREHGLPTASEAAASGIGARSGPEKCVFIYNANQNRFSENWFEGCEIGIHFTAGSERNEIVGNAFVRNRSQVKYVGTRYLDWSHGGRGNYWSDNPSFDLTGDGIADTAYRPNDLIDRVLWTTPQAKLLTNSPAVQVIRWAQSQFPALLPGGVIDSRPLIAPPPRPGTKGRLP